MVVTIEKLIFGGQGLARHDGQVVFVWGALPGEEVEIEILKKKKGFIEGIVKKVLTPSPHRVAPVDEHFDSCSPWQVMSFDEENRWKKEIAIETYRRNGNFEISDTKIDSIATDGVEYGYRNKMEYNFVFDTENKPHLAFHHRGAHRLRAIEECALATPEIQEGSKRIIEWLQKEKLPFGTLKSLVVRSDTRKKVSAALFLKRREVVGQNFHASAVKNLPGGLGLEVYYSDYRSPASVPTELLGQYGEPTLESELGGVKLRYGLLSFFQINVPVFVKALADIRHHITGGRVVDYYSGVGAISLALHGAYEEALLIEENPEAAQFAKHNAEINGFTNITVERALAERSDTSIKPHDTVILDPPRTGLHGDMVEKLLTIRPKTIIYLSCGLDTHARDIALLCKRDAYSPAAWKLYNFFPRTPHIEGLCILKRTASPYTG